MFSIWGTSESDEANRIADFVTFLKSNNVIQDYNQVAILLHSVRFEHSGKFISALEKKGISSFCPRARAYFDNEEVEFIVACYALILGYYGTGRGNVIGRSLNELSQYVDSCIVKLAKKYGGGDPLAQLIQSFANEVATLAEGESLDRRPADYLYRLLALDPFKLMMKNENRARNIAILSQLLTVFQNYYDYTVITHKNRESLRYYFFNSFLRLLFEG